MGTSDWSTIEAIWWLLKEDDECPLFLRPTNVLKESERMNVSVFANDEIY